MLDPSRVRGMLRGPAAAAGLAGTTSPDATGAARVLTAAARSLVAWDGFDGRDQAARVADLVAADPERFPIIERFFTGMLTDGAVWHEPARVLAGASAARGHEAALRALPAAIVAPENEPYRRWLAEQLVAVTHRSAPAIAAGMLAAEVAAAWLRDEGPGDGVRFEPLRSSQVDDPKSGPSACALDVVRAVISVAARAADLVSAVGEVSSAWWGDDRTVALVGAMVGARLGEPSLPSETLPDPGGLAEELVAVGTGRRPGARKAG